MDFTKSITKHIVKLVGTLKDEEELQEVLKRKFTRREYKTFIAFEEGKSIDEIKAILREEDIEEVEKLYQTAIKKLNQEIFKRELVDF
ncbi:hypothetical protein ACN2EN_01010 [Aliarcobacter lanthieri]|uniref:hypothetical protein n=1 Tax=Aliarcobacter lanthieri TaxID=1355374 RepID=UPI00047D0B7B|nr:hypothetical protein [Aliarcobacter lanthieri]QKF58248.1 hypothetical protein ALANTH_0109 [Aliarcobacter lanthieri]